MQVDVNKLFLRCAELEMTESEALAKAGVSPDLLSRIRKGSRIQAPTLAKLAKALKCRPIDLVVME